MKKTMKRIISAFVATSLALSVPFTSFAAGTDLDSHWAQPYMTKLVDLGYLHGYEDGTYRPDGVMTKAEFATLANQLFGFTEVAKEQYADVTTQEWYNNQLLIAKAAGYYYEAVPGVASPRSYLTKQEAAVMLNNIYQYDANDKALKTMADNSTVSSFAKDAVGALVAEKIIVGDPVGDVRNFNPHQQYTRAFASTMLVQAVGDIVTKNATGVTYEGNVLINSKDITLTNCTIKGNLLISKGVNGGTVTLNNVKATDGLVIVQGNAKIVTDTKTSIAKLRIQEGATFNGTAVKKNTTYKILSGKISTTVATGSYLAAVAAAVVLQKKVLTLH
jgi:hypothetical protein